ncbi:putative toxin-antitoxin system toxin component, PIN family [Candidatus Bathyarchaeota archaeon A05DMB-2]|nr:putative toxin-antitoxin system toxin component, PIN family [Candidatus Bathyarchaeota archaeon A05DMB-2]
MFDTNVLISAIISDGRPRELLMKGISKEFAIVTSDLLLRELGTVLRRPKFKTDEDEIHRIILALMQVAEVVEVVSKFNLVKEDPKDDVVVETAYDGKANFIVSGDRHLLALNSFRGIKIVRVKQMFTCFEEKTS